MATPLKQACAERDKFSAEAMLARMVLSAVIHRPEAVTFIKGKAGYSARVIDPGRADGGWCVITWHPKGNGAPHSTPYYVESLGETFGYLRNVGCDSAEDRALLDLIAAIRGVRDVKAAEQWKREACQQGRHVWSEPEPGMGPVCENCKQHYGMVDAGGLGAR